MKIRIITILFLFVFNSSASSEEVSNTKSFSFHGIRLGISEKVLIADFPEFKCEADQSVSELRRCHADFDTSKYPGVFENLRGSTIETFLTFRNNRLVNIFIPFYQKLFEPGSLLFVQHYGQPKMDQALIKNSEGAQRENIILLWTQGNESILYWKIDEDRFSKEDDDTKSKILFLIKE